MNNLKLSKTAKTELHKLEGLDKKELVEMATKNRFLQSSRFLDQDRKIIINAMVSEDNRGYALGMSDAFAEDFETYDEPEIKEMLQRIIVVRDLTVDVINKALAHDDLEEWHPTVLWPSLDKYMMHMHRIKNLAHAHKDDSIQ